MITATLCLLRGSPFGKNTNVLSQFTFKTRYWYDEAGNRIRKLVTRYHLGGGGIEESDSIVETDAGGSWVLDRDEFYVRDITGKEIAIYSGAVLQQWNLYGLDQIGYMKSDTTKYYYLKDHLGSTRAVINSTNTVVSAQDYDPWGYIMENRSYQSENSRYKFTGKERDRDIESNYDYFGARYYDSRIGRWGGVEPLLDKYISYSPYIYVFDNPILVVDIDGRGPGVDDIMPHETEILESGTGIMGGVGVISGILLIDKALEYFLPNYKGELVDSKESNITDDISNQEKITITSDNVVKETNVYTQRGRGNVKQSPDSKIGKMSDQELLARKKELSGKNRDKKEKKEYNEIKRELKGRGKQHSSQNKEYKKFKSNIDPNN